MTQGAPQGGRDFARVCGTKASCLLLSALVALVALAGCGLRTPGAEVPPIAPSSNAASVLARARELASARREWLETLQESRWAEVPGGFGRLPGESAVAAPAASSRAPYAAYTQASPSAGEETDEGADLGWRLPLFGNAPIVGGERSPTVRLHGARPARYELAEGVAVARDILPSTDALVATFARGLEVFYYLADSDAPHDWRWTLDDSTPYEVRAEGDAVVLSDASARDRYRICGRPPGSVGIGRELAVPNDAGARSAVETTTESERAQVTA